MGKGGRGVDMSSNEIGEDVNRKRKKRPETGGGQTYKTPETKGAETFDEWTMRVTSANSEKRSNPTTGFATSY